MLHMRPTALFGIVLSPLMVWYDTIQYAGETQEGYYQPLEKAELVREGGDVTILCYSRMRYVVMQAVQTLEKQGFDPEVILPCHCTHCATFQALLNFAPRSVLSLLALCCASSLLPKM